MAAKPSHRIYQIEDRGEGNKAFWREVGVAWKNADDSLNLKFAVTPHFEQHTVQIRPYDDAVEQEGGPKGKGKK